jgi:VanZ family protein
MTSTTEVGGPTARRRLAAAALAYAAFVVYASLVPWSFRPIPLDQAIARFVAMPYLDIDLPLRADAVANILIMVPLGFLLAGALRADRAGVLGDAAAALAVGLAATAFSAAIEFAQLFFPARTVSQNDILFEAIGAAVGLAVWVAFGQALTAWARAVAAERERPALAVKLLAAYAAVFALSQLMPFDLTISPGELARKWREGKLQPLPFRFPYPSLLRMAWDYGCDVVLAIPLGALATLGLTRPGTRRSTGRALALGAAAVAAIEFGQIFVYSRYASATDLVLGWVGVALGVGAAARLSGRSADPPRARRSLAVAAVLGWAALVCAYHWYPWRFVAERERVLSGMAGLHRLPLASYYAGSKFHAWSDALRKAALAAPLGALLAVAWPRAARAARLQAGVLAASIGAFFFSVEVGQCFVPGRTPDSTDVITGTLAAWLGIWVGRRIEAAGGSQGRAVTAVEKG